MFMNTQNNLKPFTKWVGGKRQLIPKLYDFLPDEFNDYYEPFLGGGALLLSLAPETAIVNDYNTGLIESYKTIQNHPKQLLELLEQHSKNNSKDYYEKIRNWDRTGELAKRSIVERAARFIYMLRVDFNGMYRVNSKNQFNVPYGKHKNPSIINKDVILSDSNYFNSANIKFLNGDFQDSIRTAKKGDLVYFDPPYIPLNITSNFTSYTSKGFELADQKRLRDTFFKLSNKGVKVMLSNSDTKLTRELYEKANIHEVKASRAINSNGKKRGKVSELIITSY